MGKQVPYPAQPSLNPSMAAQTQSAMYPMLDPVPGAPPPYTAVTVQPGSGVAQPLVPQEATTHYNTTVISTIQRPIFPASPINIQCWYCMQDIRTSTRGQATCFTWILAAVLCGIGCFCGCCLVPFCTSGTRDIIHSCPKCKKYLGTRQR